MKNLNLYIHLCGIATILAVVACNSTDTAAVTGLGSYGNTWVSTNKIYVLDTDARVIRVVNRNTGIIDAYAGTGLSGFSPDGTSATSAAIGDSPVHMIGNDEGNTAYANTNDSCVQAFENGVVKTIAGICGLSGNDGDGGNANDARLETPMGLCVDSHSNLYITDIGANVIRKVSFTTGKISTFGGNTSSGYSSGADGGQATTAPMSPSLCDFDANDNLYFLNTYNSVIQKITPEGIISTVAGNGSQGSAGDDGQSTSAQLDNPMGIAIDRAGDFLYVADTDNQVVRKINLDTGVITRFAGQTGNSGTSGDGGTGLNALLHQPEGLAFFGGDLYIAGGYQSEHRIRRIDSAGADIETVVGDGTNGNSGNTSSATAAQIQYPFSFNEWWD